MDTRNQPASPEDPRHLDFAVPAHPRSLPSVRRALGDLGLSPSNLADLRLLMTEVVANSIRHAGLGPGDEIRISVERSGSGIRVQVVDRESGAAAPPKVRGTIRPPPGAESGWGLYLVDRLSNRWGTGPGRYWFELDLGEENPGA